MRTLFLSLFSISLLTACGQDKSTNDTSVPIVPTPQDIFFAEEAVPSDPTLAGVYERSCRACHALEGLNAPLTGHAAEWQRRIDQKAFSGLLTSTQKGYKGMPAMGQCLDCTEAQFAALITFMAGGK